MKNKPKPAPGSAKQERKDQLNLALPHFRNAVQHLLETWDSLNRVESELDEEISVKDISVLGADLVEPSSAQQITLREFKSFLRQLGGAA